MIRYLDHVYIDCFFYGFWMLEKDFRQYKILEMKELQSSKFEKTESEKKRILHSPQIV